MSDEIKLKPINRKEIQFGIEGVSPIIHHKVTEKVKRQLREKHAGKKTKDRDARDPEQEAIDAMHVNEDGIPSIPSVALKASIINAAHVDLGIPKTLIKKSLYIEGEYIPMSSYSEPHTREDVVTVGRGSSDLRYRKQIDEWTASVKMQYDADILTVEDLINLINRAGFGVGLLEWRPEKSGGDYGRFRVDEDHQLVA